MTYRDVGQTFLSAGYGDFLVAKPFAAVDWKVHCTGRQECLPYARVGPTLVNLRNRPISRSAARNAALLNQCATPGLGSLLAGRRLVGIGQLLLAVAGCLMFLAWFVLFAVQSYQELINDAPHKSVGWLGLEGVAVFAVAWVWSLVTSLSILREARANESVPPA